MRKHFRRKVFLYSAILAVIVGLVVTGCAPRAPKAPGRTPRPRQAAPAPKIPPKISKGAGQEPLLNVYDTKTNSTKTMKLEDYLMGVVAGEMKPEWPVEALAAQAILARTYVLDFVSTRKSKYPNADISTDIKEAQAYAPEAISDNVRKAVQLTRGEVLVDRKSGKFITAWFHAAAGGKTARAKEGLNFKEPEPPYTKSVDSPDMKNVDPNVAGWTASFTVEEIKGALAKMGKQAGSVSTVKLGRKGPSGRTVTLQIDGQEVSAPDFRVALDNNRLRSTFFTAEPTVQNGRVTFEGKGYGHGVGMSQWGAYNMAKQGKKYTDIIHHYFADVTIKDMWK